MTLPRVALSPARLRNLHWTFATSFGFARSRLTVPLIHTEVLRVARDFPVALERDEDGAWQPVAYLGDAAGTANRFVAEDGSWTAAYVPFWLRVYPFVREGNSFSVALDPAFVGIGGEYPFEAEASDGSRLSGPAENVAAQLGRAEAARARLEAAGAALVEGGIARPRAEDGASSAIRTPAGLAFVAAGAPAEVMGPRIGAWLARDVKIVELAVAAAFSSAHMPRAAPAAVTLDPAPRPAGKPKPVAPLYVPNPVATDLDWLDTDEKVVF
ncbi:MULTISPECIES: SapC family protein [Methylobacterium]|uniref:SapC family protein n=1 Tax=Methylobacterium jeotgali TaxID=381630 RepID=A0ABQ4SZH2_9HYPH|nr:MULTISPECIES: SapC family protein [Methylobacterium]PIU04763.1 MAG: hypothetical protein COT56_18295 [Methylobacterium sp. CG09_land_8_20_14_0_10_71_15]PIU16239.1 MAG: hypothetical protein COT28_01080 [Methylobacterium sp. CG08_land_8_20_14_0_20_71_15]GBU17168.1 hypothetical protein AwMethylo_13830 [Methylobacterium sp.]GJE07915.1 hypothetical protein AOPFMNJM_3247 [Methylobacterium jeotgali]